MMNPGRKTVNFPLQHESFSRSSQRMSKDIQEDFMIVITYHLHNISRDLQTKQLLNFAGIANYTSMRKCNIIHNCLITGKNTVIIFVLMTILYFNYV